MTVPGVGQILRDARERRQLTIEQLSRDTTIPVGDIEALEAGLVEALPRAMYRRAEVRAYAEAVGLDPDVILTQLRTGHSAGASEINTSDVVSRQVATVDRASSDPVPARASTNHVSTQPRLPVIALAPIPQQVLDLVPVSRTAVNKTPVDARVTSPLHRTAARAGRAVVVLIIGCAGLLWEQAGAPSIEMPIAPAMAVPALDPQTLIDEAVRIAEPPPASPTLRRALFEPAIAVNGKRWPSDFRLDEGVLVVHSTPRGARVTVNGVGWGVTPVAIRYLPMGTLRVRVGKADYAATERVVKLTPDQPNSTLRVTLPALARRRAASAPAFQGDMLVITSEPAGARVTVNGIGWGTTPVSITHLPGGTQRVRVVKDHFKSEERVVTVREGQPGRVAFTLKPLS